MIMLAPSSRALVVMQPQSTRVEGVNIVMKSSGIRLTPRFPITERKSIQVPGLHQHPKGRELGHQPQLGTTSEGSRPAYLGILLRVPFPMSQSPLVAVVCSRSQHYRMARLQGRSRLTPKSDK